MTNPEPDLRHRLDALLRLDYPVVLRRRGSDVILEVPSLRVVGQGPSLEAAEASLERAKAELFRAYLEAGLGAEIPAPRSGGMLRDALRRGLPVAIAGLVLAALLALTGILVTGPIVTAIRGRLSPEELAVRAGSVLGEASERLERLSPERREQIRADLERIVRNLEPFARTLRPLFAPSPPAGDAPPVR
jgi:hypothetical protein